MAVVLKVSPETLAETADDMEQQICAIRDRFRSVDEEIGRTGSFWEGDAYDFHQAGYAALKATIDETMNRLKDHPVNLLRMAGLYTETESDLETLIQALPADVIV